MGGPGSTTTIGSAVYSGAEGPPLPSNSTYQPAQTLESSAARAAIFPAGSGLGSSVSDEEALKWARMKEDADDLDRELLEMVREVEEAQDKAQGKGLQRDATRRSRGHGRGRGSSRGSRSSRT